jgi:hypothetical protein
MDNIDYHELNERVEQALERRKNLTRIAMYATSVFIFLVFVILAWLIASGALDAATVTNPDMDNVTAAMILLTIGGFMTLVLNGIGMLVGTKGFEKQIRREVLVEQFGDNLQELATMKRKRSEERLGDETVMEISDDGELIPVEERKQQSRG